MPNKVGVLLTNLGTPAAPTAEALRPYLEEFLSDRRVIDYPAWLWQPILRRFVLRTRPRKSAALYANIWTQDGSPILHYTRQLALAVQRKFEGTGVVVSFGMRYGQPALRAGLDTLLGAGVRRIFVIPLYPQFSRTTTQTTLDVIKAFMAEEHPAVRVDWVADYYQNPAYIEAIAASLRTRERALGTSERLLFSYHGIPKRYAWLGDPYEKQCRHSSQLVAEALGLKAGEWAAAFQSRFGPEPWVQPYTLETLQRWARQGVRRVRVICPGFSIDCLETLDEVNREYRHQFLQAGGEMFDYVPALNASELQVELVKQMIEAKAMNPAIGQSNNRINGISQTGF